MTTLHFIVSKVHVTAQRRKTETQNTPGEVYTNPWKPLSSRLRSDQSKKPRYTVLAVDENKLLG